MFSHCIGIICEPTGITVVSERNQFSVPFILHYRDDPTFLPILHICFLEENNFFHQLTEVIVISRLGNMR